MSRGERLTELLKQQQYAPMPVEEQVVAIFAGVNGYLDEVAVGDISRFEDGLLSRMRADHGGVLAAIRGEQEISDETGERLRRILADYKIA